jgi:2-polyprenyl-6-methoxyphenol hydroxylase-like FAD-dependent oxidoreductase
MQHDQARRTSIAIVGGGIGGLTAAACLLHAGFDVDVYEQASKLSEIGAGINIGPNASRILHRLGIAEELKKAPLSRRASISGGGMMGGSCFVLRWGKR